MAKMKQIEEDGQGVLLNLNGEGIPSKARPFLVEHFPTIEQVYAEQSARESELKAQRKAAQSVLNRYRKAWKEVPGVVGMSVTYRTKLNRIISPLQIAIQIDVKRKISREELRKKMRKNKKLLCFDRLIDDIPTKVREMEFYSSSPPPGAASGNGGKAVLGGNQIALVSASNAWGTLGICVPTTGGLVAISNGHVLPETNRNAQVPGGSSPPARVIGRVLDTDTRRARGGLDIASVTALPGATFSEGIKGLNLGKPMFADNSSFLRLSQSIGLKPRFWKVGARTSLTELQLISKSTSISVEDLVDNEDLWFDDVMEFSACCGSKVVQDEGDSGGVVVGTNGMTFVVVGLTFAKSRTGLRGFAIPFGRVVKRLRELGLPVVSGRTITLR